MRLFSKDATEDCSILFSIIGATRSISRLWCSAIFIISCNKPKLKWEFCEDTNKASVYLYLLIHLREGGLWSFFTSRLVGSSSMMSSLSPRHRNIRATWGGTSHG